jgi:hypothetical protein
MKLLPLWYRLYRALELALGIWSIYEYPFNSQYEPFADIRLRTALEVGWGIWGERQVAQERKRSGK